GNSSLLRLCPYKRQKFARRGRARLNLRSTGPAQAPGRELELPELNRSFSLGSSNGNRNGGLPISIAHIVWKLRENFRGRCPHLCVGTGRSSSKKYLGAPSPTRQHCQARGLTNFFWLLLCRAEICSKFLWNPSSVKAVSVARPTAVSVHEPNEVRNALGRN